MKTDEALVRKSVDALLSCAKNIRALELGRPILIVVDFLVDEESLVRFEQLRTIVWLTRSFRDVPPRRRRAGRRRLPRWRRRELAVSAQSLLASYDSSTIY